MAPMSSGWQSGSCLCLYCVKSRCRRSMFLHYCAENSWLHSGTSGGLCRIGGRKFPGPGLFLLAAPSLFRSLSSFAHQRGRSPPLKHMSHREYDCDCYLFGAKLTIDGGLLNQSYILRSSKRMEQKNLSFFHTRNSSPCANGSKTWKIFSSFARRNAPKAAFRADRSKKWRRIWDCSLRHKAVCTAKPVAGDGIPLVDLFWNNRHFFC